MKRILISLSIICLVATSCVTEDVPADTPSGNLEFLWKILDRHYCFFDEKKAEYGVDWDEVRARYAAQVTPGMTNMQLFDLCAQMLAELRDGHVNLTASHDMARYWKWNEDFPVNYSDSIMRRYIGTDYRMASGIKYRVLEDPAGNIGYMRVATFENGIGTGNLSEIFRAFSLCKGVVVDVRGNGGGMITSAERLAECFVVEKTTVAYMRHKDGPGHNDFSSLKAVKISPSEGARWLRPVVVLTSRGTYSAANTFVMYVKDLPQVTVIGDRTGGGAGMPFNSELPNGWIVRFSACPMYDINKQSTEEGIDPDVKVDISSDDWQRGVDTILDTALQRLRSK